MYSDICVHIYIYVYIRPIAYCLLLIAYCLLPVDLLVFKPHELASCEKKGIWNGVEVVASKKQKGKPPGFSETHHGRVITVFSASNLGGHSNNDGAVIQFTAETFPNHLAKSFSAPSLKEIAGFLQTADWAAEAELGLDTRSPARPPPAGFPGTLPAARHPPRTYV